MQKTCRDPRKKRKVRIRKRVHGTLERPRMCVFRSGKHIYAQIINDIEGRVIVSASSLTKEFQEKAKKGSSIESAKIVGAIIADKALAKDLSQVVFDRNGYLYHGRIKALADAAREGGLKFFGEGEGVFFEEGIGEEGVKRRGRF